MSATVYKNVKTRGYNAPQCVEVRVKNLGYILRNWQYMEYLGFNRYCFTFDKEKSAQDGELVAKNKYYTYITDFASFDIALQFINRPVFKGLPFNIVYPNGEKPNQTIVIGSQEHLDLIKKGI